MQTDTKMNLVRPKHRNWKYLNHFEHQNCRASIKAIGKLTESVNFVPCLSCEALDHKIVFFF